MINKFLRGKRVVLASNSPRRKELMALLCNDYQVIPSSAEETVPDEVFREFSDAAADTTVYLAKLKAEDVASKETDAVVIGCDTVVAVDDKILGKPASADDANAMLRLLSGREHRVISGVCICYNKESVSFFCETKVIFRELTDEDIDNYIASGEPFDKAGAYGIQGYGALLAQGIVGDFFNVVGFPVSMINQELLKLYEK